MKRLFDLAGAVGGLVSFSPVMGVVALRWLDVRLIALSFAINVLGKTRVRELLLGVELGQD